MEPGAATRPQHLEDILKPHPKSRSIDRIKPSNLMRPILAGAGVKRGFIPGSSDAKGDNVADKQTSIQDFHATIGHLMGMNTHEVVMSPSNRPFTIGDKGSVIADVLA